MSDDQMPARTAPRQEIFEYFLAAEYEENPYLDKFEAEFSAKLRTDRYMVTAHTAERQALIRKLDQIGTYKMLAKESIDFLFQDVTNPSSVDTLNCILDGVKDHLRDIEILCEANRNYAGNRFTHSAEEEVMTAMREKYQKSLDNLSRT